MEKKKQQSIGYQAAIGGGKILLRLLIYILIIMAIVFVGKQAYQFGYDVFAQKPMASKVRAKEIEVIVTEEMSVHEIGKLLESKGLIEDPVIFVVQEFLFENHGEIRTGRHTLSTSQTPDEMLAVMTTVSEGEEE